MISVWYDRAFFDRTTTLYRDTKIMKTFTAAWICGFILLAAVQGEAAEKKTIGWLEMARVYPGNLKIRAKMDTGAKSSSINAFDLHHFEKDGKAWVRFELRDKKASGKIKKVVVEREIIRAVSIKKRGGGTNQRPVVLLEICVAGVHKQIEVNLMDRSNFNYQLLIGRQDLKKDFIIDPEETFTRKPECRVTVELEPAK